MLNEKLYQVRLAYYREWRSNNKDKVKASNKRYREKKAKEKLKKEAQENDSIQN